MTIVHWNFGPILTWQHAEYAAGAYMRKWGFADATLTGGSSDSGVDVASSIAVAQVKWEKAPVGRPKLQALYGARAGESDKLLLFFSRSGYTAPAVEYATTNGIALFQLGIDGQAHALNPLARRLARPVAALPRGVERSINNTWAFALICGAVGLLSFIVCAGNLWLTEATIDSGSWQTLGLLFALVAGGAAVWAVNDAVEYQQQATLDEVKRRTH